MPNINELTLAKELIKFPSVTPVDAGAIGFLAKQLRKLGFDCKILEFKDKNRISKPIKNIYARLGKKGPNLCYAGHTDVVPPGNIKDWTVNPFKPTIKNKGSAIFIHCSFSNKINTAGCIALEKKDLVFLLKSLRRNTYIKIQN